MNLPMLPVDKANHLIYGALIALAVSFVATNEGQAHMAPMLGAAAACVAGVLKEVSDYLLNRRAIAAGLPAPHGVEGLDALATTAGGMLCWLAVVIAG